MVFIEVCGCMPAGHADLMWATMTECTRSYNDMRAAITECTRSYGDLMWAAITECSSSV